jgi:putative DNA primase/helicase
MSRFAPLRLDERTDAESVSLHGWEKSASEILVPVPPDAPPIPPHPRYGEPVARWIYRTADGEVAFLVCRFEPPREHKQILPLTLWRDEEGKLCWRWKGLNAPRPLYNLDKIAANPEAMVLIVEGEKQCEPAMRVFSDAIATTSSNGAKSASKTDWTPLAGRRVLVWSDADEPGLKYGSEVTGVLRELGCEVLNFDAMALARISPDGGARDIPEGGWDAADAVEEWSDLDSLRDTIMSLLNPFASPPSYISWGAFRMGADGLTMAVTKGRGDNSQTVHEQVCASFEVLGATRDPKGRDWGKLLRWRDGDGREHRRLVTEAELQGDAPALAAKLAADGLRINRAYRAELATYLCGLSVEGRVTLVSRTGWHTVGGRDVFVLPGETLGPRSGETVCPIDAVAGSYEARGTLADWQAGVGALAADHALAVLAISAALAGPLLYLAGQEGGGLHFVGASSRGKSTIQSAAASVWGRGGSPGLVRSWRATANGLEGAAACATDTALILDEMGMIEPREMAAAVYGLANGTGKQRAARSGDLREPKSWRVMVISSGEVTITQKIGEDRGKRAKAGQEVRLLDILADRGFGFGAFDNAGPGGDAAKLSKAMKVAAVSFYGTAGPTFVHRLIAEGIDGDTIRAMVTEFVSAEIPAEADGQIVRAAERLGLVAAAGELATAFGVTPWAEGAARAAAAWALAQWIEGRGGTESAEERQAMETVRLAIEQHGESRFEPIGEDARPVNNRLGWRKGEGVDREWWIPPQVWKDEICAGLNASFVAKVLAERGLLRVQSGRGFQCKVNLGGDKRVNAYVLTAGILDGGEHES